MTRRLLFHLGATGIYLHPLALLLAAVMTLMGLGAWLAVSMLSILLHESAHAIVSACFGKPPQEVEITPMGALMRLEDDEALPLLPRLLTLLAGPAMTLGLCALALWMTQRGWMSAALGRLVFINNAAMLLVNLLPALPLDGGRLLALLLSRLLPPRQVGRIMRGIGTALGIACILLNLWISWRSGGWNLSLASVGCFLMYSAAAGTVSRAMAEYRRFVDRKIRLESRGHLGCAWMAVTGATTLQRALSLLHPARYTMICVVEQGTGRLLGTLSEQMLMSAAVQCPSGTVASAVPGGGVRKVQEGY